MAGLAQADEVEGHVEKLTSLDEACCVRTHVMGMSKSKSTLTRHNIEHGSTSASQSLKEGGVNGRTFFTRVNHKNWPVSARPGQQGSSPSDPGGSYLRFHTSKINATEFQARTVVSSSR